MARIRTIKPSFFSHYDLYQAEKETSLPLRVAYAGLWTQADREGRFKWCSPELKLGCLPYDDLDFSRVLDALCTRGFIVKYASNGRDFGFIPSFSEHQVINNREAASVLPEPNENNTLTRTARVDDASTQPLNKDQGEGKGKEGKGKEGADPRKRGSRLQTDWTLPEDWKAWALKEQPSWTQAHVEKVATGFRNYWVAKSGKDAAKLDWYATWQNWVMREPALNSVGKAANWWDDDQATLAKGREYGLEPRSGEDWRAFKARINERLRVAA